MIEIKDIAKETQETLQSIAELQEDTEPRPTSVYDAISSLCEDIRTFYRDAGDNLFRAKAIRQLADAYKILASIPQPVDVTDPVQLMQGLKDYCAAREDCRDCPVGADRCTSLLGDKTSPEEWDLED